MPAPDPIYDESKVPPHALPDALVCEDGQAVGDDETWFMKRRPEILEQFEQQMYGHIPGRPKDVLFDSAVVESSDDALGGTALRRQVSIRFMPPADRPRLDLLMYLPKNVPCPVFLGLNFWGNHTVCADPAVLVTDQWVPENAAAHAKENRASEQGRGCRSHRWPVELIVSRGYGLVTAYYGDLDPDHDDGYANGVHPLYDKPDATRRPNSWGAISAWAWGLRRAMDYLETCDAVDSSRVAVMGHSRLGKTALWAAANDDRFAMAISNGSGCCGAAIERRGFGETYAHIRRFSHWFCPQFYMNGDVLPVDQHQLISLIAPRPVYVASAEEDQWADPKGEFLGLKHAEPVYELLGRSGVGADEWPVVEAPVRDYLGYHVRRGKHDVTEYDWGKWLDFADRHFKEGAV